MAAEDLAGASKLPAGGFSRWRNVRLRALVDVKVGSVFIRHWPQRECFSLPNEVEREARALGLECLGPVSP